MTESIEIERKFLLDRLPGELEEHQATDIEQGYVAVEAGMEVRLRRKGDRYFETVKGSGDLVRRELEVELTAEQFETLWPATEGRRVVKTRYTVPVGALLAEVDVYHDELYGLATAEVEFDSVEASASFSPPQWFAREVTEDARYKNRNLALDGLPAGDAP